MSKWMELSVWARAGQSYLVYDSRLDGVFWKHVPEELVDDGGGSLQLPHRVGRETRGRRTDHGGARMVLICNEPPETQRAFDVMMRRFWFPRFIGSLPDGRQQWKTYSGVACKELDETMPVCLFGLKPDLVRNDPCEAILAAEKWWVEEVEVEMRRTGG